MRVNDTQEAVRRTTVALSPSPPLTQLHSMCLRLMLLDTAGRLGGGRPVTLRSDRQGRATGQRCVRSCPKTVRYGKARASLAGTPCISHEPCVAFLAERAVRKQKCGKKTNKTKRNMKVKVKKRWKGCVGRLGWLLLYRSPIGRAKAPRLPLHDALFSASPHHHCTPGVGLCTTNLTSTFCNAHTAGLGLGECLSPACCSILRAQGLCVV